VANYTVFVRSLSGETVYAKPLPLVASPWSTGVVAFAENGTTGSYSATLDDATEYEIFRQLGASPAASDAAFFRLFRGVPQSGDSFARLGAPAGDSIAADIAGIDGGGGSVTVIPMTGTVLDRSVGTNINLFTNETPTVAIAVVDALGANVDLTGMVLTVVFETTKGVDVAVVDDSDINVDESSISFVIPSDVTDKASTLKWSLRNESSVLLNGFVGVNYSPSIDV
jgi:hypothetical protein